MMIGGGRLQRRFIGLQDDLRFQRPAEHQEYGDQQRTRVENGHARQETVDAIQHPPMTRQDVAAVLDSAHPLGQALEEIAAHRKGHGKQREEHEIDKGHGLESNPESHGQCQHHRRQQGAINTLDRLARADRLDQFGETPALADEIGGDIGQPDQQHEIQDLVLREIQAQPDHQHPAADQDKSATQHPGPGGIGPIHQLFRNLAKGDPPAQPP